MKKTLGQIAYEAATKNDDIWPAWELVSTKGGWEAIAQAVRDRCAEACDGYVVDDAKNDDAKRCASAVRRLT